MRTTTTRISFEFFEFLKSCTVAARWSKVSEGCEDVVRVHVKTYTFKSATIKWINEETWTTYFSRNFVAESQEKIHL